MPNSAKEPNEMTRRIRAAQGYSGHEQVALIKDLVRSTGRKEGTWRNYFNKGRPNAPSDQSVLDVVAAATGVPEWFMRGGWEGWKDQPMSPDQTHVIQQALGELLARIERLEAEIPASKRRGAVTPAVRDASFQSLAGLVQSHPDEKQPTIRPAPGTDGDSE
jgi:hypothetical protein